MFRFTDGQRRATVKILTNLITVDAATLLAGNVFSPRGFFLPAFVIGCILVPALYLGILWLLENERGIGR